MIAVEDLARRLTKTLADERFMLVLNGSMIGYLFFLFTFIISASVASHDPEHGGGWFFILLIAWSYVLPLFILVLKGFEVRGFEATTLSFAAFTPWVIAYGYSQRAPGLIVLTIVSSLWSCLPLFALVSEDVWAKKLGAASLSSILLTFLALFYIIFLHPIVPNWLLYALPLPIAEYLIKLVVLSLRRDTKPTIPDS